MKKRILLAVTLLVLALGSFAQFTFIHLSDLHVCNFPFEDSDTNAQYFQCCIKEFVKLDPKPAFVVVSGDVSNIGNLPPDGMYPTFTQYLFPPSQTNPGIGDYFIDSAMTIPIYFVPGNHEYWTALENPPVSNDTLKYYSEYLIPDTDYVVTTNLAVVVFLRSGSDSTLTIENKKGRGLTDEQIAFLRTALNENSGKRKIIVMHHPGVNAIGTNSDGTPYTGEINTPEDNSIAVNRDIFLNICDSNHVDVVLCGHEHQNVVANRAGQVIPENGSDSTRYVQTAAEFNRSYRIITVDPSYVTVSNQLRFCINTGIEEPGGSAGFSFYPNPATDELTIESAVPSHIEIMNIEGQIVKSLTTNDISTAVDLAAFPGGVYFIKAITPKGIVVKKLVKQ
jgi:3',5'-cyclic AMP phosphodiesterase CpdA